jgi:hypothetical protein
MKREAQMEELQQKIEKQRAARLSEAAALEEEMRQIRIKKQFLAAGASQMEEKKWLEIEKGAERAIAARVSQRNMTEAARAHELSEDEGNRKKHHQDIEAQRLQFAKMYEVKVQQKREIAENESALELARKAALAQSQRQFEVNCDGCVLNYLLLFVLTLRSRARCTSRSWAARPTPIIPNSRCKCFARDVLCWSGTDAGRAACNHRQGAHDVAG